MTDKRAKVSIRSTKGGRPALSSAKLADTTGVAFGPTVEISADAVAVKKGAEVSFTLPDALGRDQKLAVVYWNTRLDAWEPVTTKLSVDRRTATAQTTHFSIWSVVSSAANGVGHFFDQRADPPKCAGSNPKWVDAVTFVDDQNAPLLWCTGSDPKRPDLLVVKVRVNRGYGLRVRPLASTSWQWNSFFNMDAGALTQAVLSDLNDTLAGAVIADWSGGKQVVPGGEEVDFAFSQKQVQQAKDEGNPLVVADEPNALDVATTVVFDQLDLLDATNSEATPFNRVVGFAAVMVSIYSCVAAVTESGNVARIAGALKDCSVKFLGLAAGFDPSVFKKTVDTYNKLTLSSLSTEHYGKSFGQVLGKAMFLLEFADVSFLGMTYVADINFDKEVRQLSVFVARVKVSRPITIGPETYGPFRMGMTQDQATEAWPAIKFDPDAGACPTAMFLGARLVFNNADARENPGGLAWVEPAKSKPVGAPTGGIRIGMTMKELRSAHPDMEDWAQTTTRFPVTPGAATRYVIKWKIDYEDFDDYVIPDDATVAEVWLDRSQSCFG